MTKPHYFGDEADPNRPNADDPEPYRAGYAAGVAGDQLDTSTYPKWDAAGRQLWYEGWCAGILTTDHQFRLYDDSCLQRVFADAHALFDYAPDVAAWFARHHHCNYLQYGDGFHTHRYERASSDRDG